MRVCIIANSPDFEEQSVLARAREAALVIVTDGAIERIPAQLAPHIVCGDMDSHDPKVHGHRFPDTEWVNVACQESNDLEKAIRIAIQRGATEVELLCSFGGRIDQTLITLSVMEAFSDAMPITLFHNGWEVRMCGVSESRAGTHSCDLVPEALVSLIVRGDKAVVSLDNVQWPLTKEVLSPGSRGLSNRALGGVVTLTVEHGCVAVCYRSEDKTS